MRHLSSGILGVLFLIFVVTVLVEGRHVKSIEVRYTGEGKEHQDKYLPGINSEEKPPDYGLEIRVKQEWRLVGVKPNRFLGEGSAMYVPPSVIPMLFAEELRWFDQDKLEHDILEILPLEKGLLQGTAYSFDVKTGFSLAAGMEVFWDTPVGKAILMGITICIILLVFQSGVF